MKKNFSWKQNIVALILGGALALGIFYVWQNPELLEANVLSVHDKEILVNEGRDVGYNTESSVLDVYVSEEIGALRSLMVEILFDEESVDFDFEKIEFQGSYDILWHENGLYRLAFKNLDGLNYGESLFVLPFEGDDLSIVLWRVTGDKTGEAASLRVGNLDQNDKHRD